MLRHHLLSAWAGRPSAATAALCCHHSDPLLPGGGAIVTIKRLVIVVVACASNSASASHSRPPQPVVALPPVRLGLHDSTIPRFHGHHPYLMLLSMVGCYPFSLSHHQAIINALVAGCRPHSLPIVSHYTTPARGRLQCHCGSRSRAMKPLL